MSIFTVDIDVPGIEKFTLAQATTVINQVVNDLGSFAQDRVLQMANERLDPKSAKAYHDAVTVTRADNGGRITIAMQEGSSSRLETGSSSFDIKIALLRSSKAKAGKNGLYIDIPFDHTTSKRQRGNQVTGYARRIVKALAQEAMASGQRRTAFKGRWSPDSKYRRQADMRIKPQGSKSASMTTFRRVSANSAADSWIYPAKPGLQIFKQVSDEVLAVKDRVIADALAKRLPHE